MDLTINGYKNDDMYGNHDVPETYEEQRTLLLAIEERIKELCSDELPTDRMLAAGRKTLAERSEVDGLLQWRRSVLNGMLHDDECEQYVLDQIKQRLGEMEEKVINECCRLNKMLARHTTDEGSPFTHSWIEGVVSYLPPTNMPDSQFFDRCSFVEHDFDDYYGSDFPYMLSLIGLVEMEHDYTSRLRYLSADLNPSAEEFRRELLGESDNSAFKSLRLYFSDVDIMHLNRFKAEANFRVMGSTDRDGFIDYETYIPATDDFFEEEVEAFDYSKHVTHNREEIEASKKCGCASCCKIFPANEVTEYTDKGTTAICPHCGTDAVIGDTGCDEIYKGFLLALNRKWF